jgi:hypothetical protein
VEAPTPAPEPAVEPASGTGTPDNLLEAIGQMFQELIQTIAGLFAQ